MLAGGLFGFNWDPVKTAMFVGSIILVVVAFTFIGWHWPWNGRTRNPPDPEPLEPAFRDPERPEFRRPSNEGDLL
jgi:hypothetical protein